MAIPEGRKYELTEKKREGLKLEYEVTVRAPDLPQLIQGELNERKKTFQMAGFRAGNVPDSIIRSKFFEEVATAKIQDVVQETLKQILEEHKMRPAMPPQVNVVSHSRDEEGIITFILAIEVYPDVPTVIFTGIKLKRPKIIVSEEDIKRAYDEITNNFKNFTPAEKGHAARMGDAVVINFKGTVDGKGFEGDSGDGIRLELGSGQFVNGFEEQLVDAKAGDHRTVTIRFPADYSLQTVASKEGVFEVDIIDVLVPSSVSNIDDAFAKSVGFEDVKQLDDMIRSKIKADFEVLGRLYMKKALFDQMDAQNKFSVPDSMMQLDFDTMWKEIRSQAIASSPGQSEDDVKRSYKEVAARRVRLGIILAELAREHKIEVVDQELQQAVLVEAMQRPGQEKMVLDFYRKRENLERLRGPLLEEKVVDHIVNKMLNSEQVQDEEISSKDFVERYAPELQLPTTAPAA